MTLTIRVCLLEVPPLAPHFWEQFFAGTPVRVEVFVTGNGLVEYVQTWGEQLDCLVFVAAIADMAEIHQVCQQLCQLGLLWPAVLVVKHRDPHAQDPELLRFLEHKQKIYHNALVVLVVGEDVKPETLVSHIQEAINLFVQIAPTCELPPPNALPQKDQRQQQLAEKLRERLGYLGVYYQRDPQRFYRHLPPEERKSLMQRLRGLYQAIILDYFQAPATANSRIDEFAALAFLSDLSVSHVLELHMSLMDAFAKQLKLEGRSEEILLDYRITLIDVIAHLAELYRRALPKEKQ
ncbi:MAG: circadian clock protein KaiA [Thermostichales cyanobacterium BF4_bins_65]